MKKINITKFVFLFVASVLMIQFSFFDRLGFYIHPRYFLFTKIFSIILFLFTMLLIFNEIRLIRKNSYKYRIILLDIIFIAILLVSIVLPSRSLSSQTFIQRQSDLNSVLDSQPSISDNFSTDTSSFTLKDWSVSFKYNSDPSFYKDKKVKLDGFIFSQESFDENVFMISRFVISCCAVDSRPLGIYVQYDWKNEFNQDEWVEVEGVFSVGNIEGKDAVIIIPNSISKISQPNDPYIY